MATRVTATILTKTLSMNVASATSGSVTWSLELLRRRSSA